MRAFVVFMLVILCLVSAGTLLTVDQMERELKQAQVDINNIKLEIQSLKLPEPEVSYEGEISWED